jgi:hypothetical protein
VTGVQTCALPISSLRLVVQRSDSAGIHLGATPETSHGVGCYRKLAFNHTCQRRFGDPQTGAVLREYVCVNLTLNDSE